MINDFCGYGKIVESQILKQKDFYSIIKLKLLKVDGRTISFCLVFELE